jgi:hypothetical protein
MVIVGEEAAGAPKPEKMSLRAEIESLQLA